MPSTAGRLGPGDPLIYLQERSVLSPRGLSIAREPQASRTSGLTLRIAIERLAVRGLEPTPFRQGLNARLPRKRSYFARGNLTRLLAICMRFGEVEFGTTDTAVGAGAVAVSGCSACLLKTRTYLKITDGCPSAINAE
jgi:hypothetical protein